MNADREGLKSSECLPLKLVMFEWRVIGSEVPFSIWNLDVIKNALTTLSLGMSGSRQKAV